MTGDPQFDNIVCPCNTISDFPQVCPYHSRTTLRYTYPATTTTFQWPPAEPRISDEDVERIAQRVAALLKPKRKARK